MKRILRILSIVLIFVLVFSTLISCEESTKTPQETAEASTADNKDTAEIKPDESTETDESATDTATENESETQTETKTETETVKDEPSVERKDYGSYLFLHIHGDVNPVQFYWVEEGESDVLSQAIYDRQTKVGEYLGIDIYGVRTPTANKYIEPFKNAVKNKDGSVHILLTHNYNGIASLISENFFRDLNEVPHINLFADYWNIDFMDSISLKDHRYLGFSDFNILYTNVIAFNKSLMDKYGSAVDESLYSMVENYRWTLDQMISLANLVYIDSTGDGKTVDDTFGISGLHAVPFVNFLQASDINLIDISESGSYKVSVYNETNKAKTATLVDKIHALAKSDCSWFWRSGEDTVQLTTGRTLMQLTPSINLPNYLNYDIEFGVLPYPLFDENQKDVGYRSLQWGGYIAIPSYVDNIDMTAETIEMLSYFSEEVNIAFYDKLLGKQVADTIEDKKMLSIIWDSVCSDFGQTYAEAMPGIDLLYLVPRLTEANTTKNITSFMASIEKSADKLITKFLMKIE